jgi:nicotinamidase-related amidase
VKLLNSNHTVLLVVDIQDKLLPVVIQPEAMTHHVGILLQSAKALDIPVVVTEQYPQGLGATVPELVAYLPESAQTFAKTAFGCLGDAAIANHLASLKASQGRNQVIVCGLEAHVCVSQTVQQLIDAGFEPHVVQDAVSSRRPDNLMLGLAKMNQSGAILTGTEMALFELLADAQHPQFKALQALVK